MELYAGLFLVAIGIGYLTVRVLKSRSISRIKRRVKTGDRSGSGKALGNNQKDFFAPVSASSRANSRGKSAGKPLKKSALMVGTIQKPWGW